MTSKKLSEFVAAQERGAGALGDHIATFATMLARRGYAESTAKQYIRLAAEFGYWLGRKEVLVFELDERRLAEFLSHLRRRGRAARSHITTLRILLGVLRDSGVVRTVDAEIDTSPTADVERMFARHLTEERGLHTSTVTNYVRVVRRFLLKRFRGGCIRLGELRPADVTRFVADEARTRPRCMPVIVPALRVFLRWLQQRGDTETGLMGCVPAVAAWQLATLPKALPTDHVKRLLQHCSRATAVGLRDYAMLLVLARLGLRAGELVSMKLDDINWESGDLLVRSKGGREDRLPLPRDVGAAVAAYLSSRTKMEGPSCGSDQVS
jgi:site-specific recombinase XerD